MLAVNDIKEMKKKCTAEMERLVLLIERQRGAIQMCDYLIMKSEKPGDDASHDSK